MKNIKSSGIYMFIVLSMLFVGCTNKEVVNDYNEYNRLYVEVVSEIITESGDKIENLKEEQVIEKLEQMDAIVARMNETASSKKERSMLSNVLSFEEGIDFLKYAADNEKNLTGDEKIQCKSAIMHAERRKLNIEEGDVIR